MDKKERPHAGSMLPQAARHPEHDQLRSTSLNPM